MIMIMIIIIIIIMIIIIVIIIVIIRIIIIWRQSREDMYCVVSKGFSDYFISFFKQPMCTFVADIFVMSTFDMLFSRRLRTIQL